MTVVMITIFPRSSESFEGPDFDGSRFDETPFRSTYASILPRHLRPADLFYDGCNLSDFLRVDNCSTNNRTSGRSCHWHCKLFECF
jgi:hypothetical protein